MAANRSNLLTKTYKVLKKHYTPVVPNLRLPLLQQLIYACCLEDATAEVTDQAFVALETQYYDWNEVRVSTVTELSESMPMLPDAVAAAARAKRVLQSVFEGTYSFDLEHLKKENIGAAVKKLNKFKGVTPFAASYVTQTALAGHSIPVSKGAFEVLYIVGVVSEKEKTAASVPGLERAIPKNKGIEFGSLLNQLGAEFSRAPHGPVARKIMVEIAPDAKERLPRRRSKKEVVAKEPPAKEKKAKEVKKKAAPAKKATPAKKKVKKKTATKKKAAPKRKKTSKKKATAAKTKKKVLKKKKTSATKRLAKKRPR